MNNCFPREKRSIPAAMALLLLIVPAAARAHTGRAPEPHDLWSAWSAQPVVLVAIGAGTWAYLLGVRRLWARAGRGHGVAAWRVGCWLGGMLAVAIALLSPVDAVSEALFAVHMVQHLLLMLAAAPLIALAEPLLPMLWAMPQGARRAVGGWWRRAFVLRAVWRAIARPFAAWMLHVGAVLLWHLPRLYDAAARDPAVHVLEHLGFVATAVLFWWVLTDRRARRHLGTGAAILYLFTAALASTLLGAAIALAPHPWYTAHWGTTAAWGLTPLEDQQIAGLIMWVPAGLVYLIALAPLLVRVLRRDHVARARTV
jgi:putative membrane protein